MRTMIQSYGLLFRLPALAAVAVILALAVSGCQEQLDLSTLPQQTDTLVDTSYVELFPPFSGFSGAEDILIGNDQLLYVADTKANRVVMMNRAGQILSEKSMLHPLSLAQDTRLDLLVGGEVALANGDTAGAISACILCLRRRIRRTILRYRQSTPSGSSMHVLTGASPDWRCLATIPISRCGEDRTTAA